MPDIQFSRKFLRLRIIILLLNTVQYLFRCDHILYTIVTVSGKQSLEKAFHENSEGVSTIQISNILGMTIMRKNVGDKIL